MADQLSTSLTPGVKNLFNPDREVVELRRLIEGCLKSADCLTACTLADSLLQLDAADIQDVVLFARCFFSAGEYNRSLTVLEHEGLLSAQRIAEVSEFLLPADDPYVESHSSEIEDSLRGLQAIHLASKCLIGLEQHEDCMNLLEPVLLLDTLDTSGNKVVDDDIIMRARKVFSMIERSNVSDGLNLIASLYCMAGKCFDILENRNKAKLCLIIAMKIDAACTEALNYLISNGLINLPDRKSLYESLESGFVDREWLEKFYRFQLLDEYNVYSSSPHATHNDHRDGDEYTDFKAQSFSRESLSVDDPAWQGRGTSKEGMGSRFSSAMILVRKAEKFFDKGYFSDSYRLARQAYIIDPFHEDGLIVYIGNMVELGLKTELFYLSHEMVNTSVKKATSWYAVGCYYWVSRKLEHAQKYLQKTVKMEKRFSQAWVVLGHVLAAQEESENAISAFRVVTRLLPSDPRPVLFMAKELLRTNYLSLALHLLTGALKLSPNDSLILNELGVVSMKQDNLVKASEYLEKAANIVVSGAKESSLNENGIFLREGRSCSDAILSNYATVLRRLGHLSEAHRWYQACLAINPTSAELHAQIGFTLHLSRRYTNAIDEYHKSLAIRHSPFCADMLSKAMNDLFEFGDDSDGLGMPLFGIDEVGRSQQPAHLNFSVESL